MKSYILCLLFFIISPLAKTQSTTTCRIYQYSGDDSINVQMIAEKKIENGHITYEHLLGYKHQWDDCFFLSDGMEYPLKTFYFYRDTLLSKKITVTPENDSNIYVYFYDSHNKLLKEQRYYQNENRWDKGYQETLYIYDSIKNILIKYKYYTHGEKAKLSINIDNITYDSKNRMISDKVYYAIKRSFTFDGISLPADGPSLIFDDSIYTVTASSVYDYNYFQSGYELNTLWPQTYDTQTDTFFFDKKNALSMRVHYAKYQKVQTEYYYYNNRNDVTKVVTECHQGDEKGKKTRLYRYEYQ